MLVVADHRHVLVRGPGWGAPGSPRPRFHSLFLPGRLDWTCQASRQPHMNTNTDTSRHSTARIILSVLFTHLNGSVKSVK